MGPLEKMIDVEGMCFEIIRQLETDFPYLHYEASRNFLDFHKVFKGGEEELLECLEMRFGFYCFKINHNTLPEALNKDIGYLMKVFRGYNIEIETEYCFDDGISINYEHYFDGKGSKIQAEDILANFPAEREFYELPLTFASQEVIGSIYRDIMRKIDKRFNELKRNIDTDSLRTNITKRLRELIDKSVKKEFRDNMNVC